jgi:chemotaxis family two-component system response regulator Rcp1
MVHILVVEDNAADMLLILEAIGTTSAKADVVVAYDGEEALRFLTEFKFSPDIIFLDLNVPKFDGLQILERSRANNASPVIVLTSSINPADSRRAFELGAREYLVKQLDLDRFLQAVTGAVERWSGNAARRAL